MADVVVLGAGLLTVAFCVAWAVRPDLRAWVERPKHQLEGRLRAFDAARGSESGRGQR